MSRKEGTRGEVRSSALWGTGSRGGESRSNALWGKGGRRVSLILVAVAVLVVPLAAAAGKSGSSEQAGDYLARWLDTQKKLAAQTALAPMGPHGPVLAPGTTYITQGLKQQADNQPEKLVRVIIQGAPGVDVAKALQGIVAPGVNVKSLDLVNGAAVNIKAGRLNDLLKLQGLTITPDALVRLSDDGGSTTTTSSSGSGSGSAPPVGSVTTPDLSALPDDLTTGYYTSKQMWPHETGNSFYWGSRTNPAPQAPTIAIVDSGIDANRADFDYGKRVVAQVNLTTLPGNSAGDGRGHGTFVAGMAAGSAPGYAGASPTSKIVMIDVMDDQGMARTSDVIAAAQWIVANKDKYGIRVANFSLHSTTPSNFTRDPLDMAVEKLWFGGVTVVVASGNYGVPTGPSGVKYAPGNDPFVITVGALDIGRGPAIMDDYAAPWSAYGRTYDGFMKPELAAPGRYVVGAIPPSSTLAAQKAANVVAPGYIQLSGTSFASPIVAGSAAQILSAHPSYTPDQVKGVLMATARPTPRSPMFSTGVGEITASKAIAWNDRYRTAPNPNKALDESLKADTAAGGQVFDAVSWYDAATASVSWDSVSWNDVSWQDVSWNDVSWQDVSWDDVSWQDVSWNDTSTSDAAADVSWEDAAEGDANSTDGVDMTDNQFAQIICDPTVNPDPLPDACTAPADGSAGSTDTTPTDTSPTDTTPAPDDPGSGGSSDSSTSSTDTSTTPAP
jgi:serine protease AprX